MIKCPNCGSTAQVQLISHDTYIWSEQIDIYLTYRCGCGKAFVTRTVTNRANEELCDEKN